MTLAHDFEERVNNVSRAQAAFDLEWDRFKDTFEDQWFPGTGTEQIYETVPKPERVDQMVYPADFLRTKSVINARDALAVSKLRLAEWTMQHWSEVCRALVREGE